VNQAQHASHTLGAPPFPCSVAYVLHLVVAAADLEVHARSVSTMGVIIRIRLGCVTALPIGSVIANKQSRGRLAVRPIQNNLLPSQAVYAPFSSSGNTICTRALLASCLALAPNTSMWRSIGSRRSPERSLCRIERWRLTASLRAQARRLTSRE